MAKLTKEANRLYLKLTKKERGLLISVRDKDEKAYRRERAAALLKISEGQSPHEVAKQRLLMVEAPQKERDPDTIYSWVKDFVKTGIKSLTHKPRRKQKRVTNKQLNELQETLIRKTPFDYGFTRSRWSLKTLRKLVEYLSDYSQAGIWYLLRRLRFSYKRAREWQRSVDKGKKYKIRRIRGCLGYARRFPQQVAFLMLDEFSYYRQPKVAQAFWPMGRRYQPPAIRHCGSHTRGRIVGALNGINGQLTYQLASSITVKVFSEFLRKLAEQYSHYSKIYIVLDNWPTVHRHPTVLALMQQLGITPLFLPIYSPESNPIEMLWHALTDEVLNLHRDSSCWTTLKEKVNNWLSALTKPSPSILKRVGLFAAPRPFSRRAIGCNTDEHWAVAYH